MQLPQSIGQRNPGPRRALLLLQVCVALALCLWLVQAALAAPSAQDAPRPLLLGEFSNISLAAGDTVQYALTAPLDGAYTVVFTGAGEADDFLLTIADAEGNALYDDALLSEVIVDLTAGDYLLTFTAERDADLVFVTGIEAGTMTADADQPGDLFNGSVFVTENVDEPLYATVTIAPSSYYQQVVILIQGGDGDIYQAEVVNEAFDAFYTSTDESELVRFVSNGGVYQMSVTPVEGGEALQISVFLSGPAPLLTWGEETAATLDAAEDIDSYQINVDTAGAIIILAAAAEDDADLTLAVGFQPETDTWSNYTGGGEPVTLNFVAPEAGIYYVSVSTSSEAGADYTILAADAGRAEQLPLGEPVRGEIGGGAQASYLVEVTEPDQFVIVVLAGPADQDLDLTIMRYADGGLADSDSAASLSGREVVGLFSEEPGVYIVVVDGSWADASEYVLLASTGALADLIDGASAGSAAATAAPSSAGLSSAGAAGVGAAIEQWAIGAEASSEYGVDSWSAQQATGPADTPEPGDKITAWAAASADAQVETLTLIFEQPVIPTGIEIYESYNPGAVARVEVLDRNSDAWVVVWEGAADTALEELAVFAPELQAVDFATDQVRLTIDEPLIAGWNEIDAVKLIGALE
jgi:hypothetical protein